MVSCAFADDILFRNLKWGCNTDDFKNSINVGYTYTQEDTSLPRWEGIKEDAYINSENTMLYTWNINPLGHIVSYYGLADAGFKVSGYSVNIVEAYFRYGIDHDGKIMKDMTDSEMYLAKYIFEASDKESAYYDLKQKLSQLYGIGEEVDDKYSGKMFSSTDGFKNFETVITRYFIQGSNNAWVLLEKMVEDGECSTLILIYADGAADRKLDELVSAQAKQEYNNGIGNYDGL